MSLRKFASIEDYVEALEGKRVIKRILIANNGAAATKGIRSLRKWAYEMFGDEKAIHIIVMATPDDIQANAGYIRLADSCIEVAGGSNVNNYANVKVIVETAQLTGAHAVWAGWGHASEYPELPDALASTPEKIVFIGPPSKAMRALGDKISSGRVCRCAHHALEWLWHSSSGRSL